MKGKTIIDNFLLAQELVEDIKKKNWGGNVVIRLDMDKTYDRVFWIYLLSILIAFGFGE